MAEGICESDEPADDAVRAGEDRGAAGSPECWWQCASGWWPAKQLSNAVPGYAAEFGLTAGKGLDKIEPLLAKIAADEALPVLHVICFAMHGREYVQLQAELKKIEARLNGLAPCQYRQPRLAQIPGNRAGRRTTLVMKAQILACSRPAGTSRPGRADAERPFHRGKTRPRHDQPAPEMRCCAACWWLGADRGDPAGAARPRPVHRLVARTAGAQSRRRSSQPIVRSPTRLLASPGSCW